MFPRLLLLVLVTSAVASPRFEENDGAYAFDTGILRGTLKGGKGSEGLTQVTDARTGSEWAISPGLFSIYRVFDRESRYGDARDRNSRSRLLGDGRVEYFWAPDEQNPYALRAVYGWADKQTLDLEITVTGNKDLPAFEVFLSSYLKGTDRSFGYAKGLPNQFVPALEAAGDYHLFPRDAPSQAMVLDGRWKRPLHPVEWTMHPEFAAALGLRRDTATGATALVMARPEDCFAVSMAHGTEPHHSLYLSLFGRTIKAGRSDSVRARLVLGRRIAEAEALSLYQAYLSRE